VTDWQSEALRWRKIARAQEKRFKKLAAAVRRLSLTLADLQELDELGVFDLELHEGKHT
jgi:hypothetical protein